MYKMYRNSTWLRVLTLLTISSCGFDTFTQMLSHMYRHDAEATEGDGYETGMSRPTCADNPTHTPTRLITSLSSFKRDFTICTQRRRYSYMGIFSLNCPWNILWWSQNVYSWVFNMIYILTSWLYRSPVTFLHNNRWSPMIFVRSHIWSRIIPLYRTSPNVKQTPAALV